MKVQFTPEARNDLKEIKAYISDIHLNPSAAANTVKNITKRARSLTDFPAMGASVSSIADVETDYRFLVCGNYTAFYRYDKKFVYIIRVLHNRRDFMRILFGITLVEDDDE